MKKIIQSSLLLFLLNPVHAQLQQDYISGDPQYLMQSERSQFVQGRVNHNFNIRPLIPLGPVQGVELQAYGASYLYYNDNAPNLENTGELFVGKGITSFSSVHFSLNHRYLYLSVEPYLQYAANKSFTYYHVSQDPDHLGELERKFHVLNDGPGRGEDPVKELRFMETQLYLHRNGIGGGFSNSGMWWGPGLHTSLNMTTNTSGIPRLVLGTLQEQRIRKVGLVAQYVFAKLDRNQTEPYYTALLGSITYYSDPVITLGGSRTFLSGGHYVREPISWQDAAALPFQAFRKEKLYDPDTGEDPSDQTDQTLSLFMSMLFPESGLKIFLEYGWNDHRWDWYDMRANPDHSGASIIGFRKYGLFDYPDLVFGFEYANLEKSPYYPLRATPDWYGRKIFDHGLYDGRRFAAHSGSDSDDMLVYVGYINEESSLTLGFNYERHGKMYSVILLDIAPASRFPEDKLELQIDFKKNTRWGEVFGYYEYEFTENLGSPPQGVFPRVDNPERKANVFGLGFRTETLGF